MALRGNFSGPISATDLVKVPKDAASLLVCTWKKVFCLEVQIFYEWRHKWRTFYHLGPLHLALGANH